MALNLRVSNIGHERFLKVPWVGGPETHEDILADHPGQLGITLCSPFHGDYVGGKVSQKDLNRLEAIGNRKSNKALAKARDEWLVQRDAAARAGDSPFWGPSAFQAPRATNSLAVTPLHQLTWRQSMSTSSTSETSHFSGQLGVGVGRSFLGASISGKYDKAVATMQDVSSCTFLVTARRSGLETLC